MNFNDFSLSLLICGIAAIATSIIIFKRSGDAVKQFSYLTFGIAIWSIAYSFELASKTYDQMMFWLRLEYIGVAFLPAMWVQFILKFIGKSHWLKMWTNALLYIIPSLTFIAVWTNDFHHLHYLNVDIDYSGPFPLLALEVGPWYIVHTIFFYVALLSGLILLIRKFFKADKVYRRQNYIIILGALIPWLINILYLFDYRPYGHIDLTPYAFITTCLVISFGLLQFKLFDIIPIARDKIIEELSEGIVVLDNLNRVVDINSQIKIISKSELNKNLEIGDDFLKLFKNHESVVEKVKERIQSILTVEINHNYFEITITPLFDKTSIYSGVILIFRNITPRIQSELLLKKQSDELVELNQLKDKMFSIISHDLRGPIMNLKEIMSFFDQKLITENELRQHLPIISTEIKSTSSLLENLLYWSRTQLKGERINPDYINLRLISLVQVNLLMNQSIEKGLSIINNIPENSVVYADKNMIELVIRNLVSNAIKYCNRGDTITLNGRQDFNSFLVEIIDSGIGISKENISKLFGVNNFSTMGTNSERGTGIGLHLCKEFIEKNKGEIWVKSELGKGSTFGFRLPLRK